MAAQGTDFFNDFYETVDSFYSGNKIEGLETYLLSVWGTNETYRAAQSAEAYFAKKSAISNELGTLYRVKGRQDLSAEQFRITADTVAELYGTGVSAYATAVNNLAGAYRLAGKHDEAIRCFQDALAAFDAAEDRDPAAYAATLNNLGLVYLGIRRTAEAKEQFGKALEALKPLEEKGENTGAERAVTYHNLASVYFLENDDEQAEAWCKKAIEAYDTVDEDMRGHLGSVYNTLGTMAHRRGEKEKARGYYELAKTWLFRFFGENYEYQKVEEKLALL